MPRFPRVYFEGALYYITTKADYNLKLFRDDDDRLRYLSFISEYKKLYNFKLYSFALTPQESFLLIEPSFEFTISQIMHDVNANYTKYYNKKYGKKGHLFEERFKAALIEKQSYLLAMTRYVHRIVLRDKAVSQLKDYRWSSYLSYIQAEQDKNISDNVDSREVLSLSAPLLGNGYAAYQEFVEKALPKDLEAFENKLYRASVVGSAEFVEKIKQISKTALEAGEQMQDENAQFVPVTKANNRLVYVLAVFMILVLGASAFLLKGNAILKKKIDKVSLEKDELFTRDLIATKQEVSRDLEEKYRADMVSYRAAAMRLQEMEKKNSPKGEKR
ncbi:MAG: transposase [Candidatus Omnitrophota bacterium]